MSESLWLPLDGMIDVDQLDNYQAGFDIDCTQKLEKEHKESGCGSDQIFEELIKFEETSQPSLSHQIKKEEISEFENTGCGSENSDSILNSSRIENENEENGSSGNFDRDQNLD